MTTSLTIGEFSKLTHLSTKALRHYHDVGLLEPAGIDPASKYRRYCTDQVVDAQLIRRLRSLDMPVDSVRQVLAAHDTVERDRVIAAHLQSLEIQLERTRVMVSSLRSLLEYPVPHLAVERRHLAGATVLAIRDTVARDDVDAWCGATFPELYAAAVETEIVGPGGGLYSVEFFEAGVGEIVTYVPIRSDSTASPRGRIEMIKLPPTDVVVALHAGPFGDLDRTYAFVGSFATEQGIATDGPIREIYLVGPDTTDDPLQLRTEVCWPVIPAQSKPTHPTSTQQGDNQP